ncbi:apoptosis-inducing factor 1, mitochondrial [Manduca sexta]|uniref:apoptosis-inducing factor 1, mitochondrial n=1 Tax=Manduca sexta TaxID=7130 RepID=UPI00188DE68B|nr:apoptosis-inducing factor 1, mitochondrial [Manduca sexta]
MLRAVSVICTESQALLLLSPARRDIYKIFRKSTFATNASSNQTVLTSDSRGDSRQAAAECPASPQPPPPTPPPPPPRQAWTVAATALAITASIGGIYFYRKISEEEKKPTPSDVPAKDSSKDKELPIPNSVDAMPRHVQFLLVGAGTASFAAMRAIRSNKPDSQVLIVGSEMQLPYMRPPLSKELWREPDLHNATDLDALTFRQWNGRTRSVSYEPNAFYTPVEELGRDPVTEQGEGDAEGERAAAVRRVGGAAVARGWTVTKVDALRHEATLQSAAGTVTITYDKCLIATGVGAGTVAALGAARACGAARRVRGVRDAVELARALQAERVRRVAVVGGGLLATELSASLANKFRDSDKSVVQLYREAAPLQSVLPPYLAADAAGRLQDAGVTLMPNADIVEGEMEDNKVRMRLASGGTVDADIVVECVGSEFDTSLADASELEVHPELGGYVVNAELQARTDVWAAGDAACFHSALGRRRVTHHDHAVASGRRAGDNMLGRAAPYTHQPMFWSDLGPQLGYEAIGIIDSSLQTVGVFCADAVTDATAAVTTAADNAITAGDLTHTSEEKGSFEQDKRSSEPDTTVAKTGTVVLPEDSDAASRRYERGVVFYLREKRVVGVLLWNLFNRMHIARQVIAQGEFEDLFEVAKLFSLHEDE